MNKRTLKVIQALLLLLKFNNRGKLVVDGEWGESSAVAAQAYIEEEGLTVEDGQTEQDVLLEHFQSSSFQFDLNDVDLNNLKVTQAYLISRGFDNNGALVADGEEGPNTKAASLAYVNAKGIQVWTLVAYHAEELNSSGCFKPTFPAAETAAASQTSAET